MKRPKLNLKQKSGRNKIDVDDFLAKTKNADLIYIDSPNNPTGFQFTRYDIQKIIKKFLLWGY